MTKHKQNFSFRNIRTSVILLLAFGVALCVFGASQAERASATSSIVDFGWVNRLFLAPDFVEPVPGRGERPVGDPPPNADSSLLLEGGGLVEIAIPEPFVSDAWTVEAWIKPAGGEDLQGIFQIGDDTTDRIRIAVAPDMTVECSVDSKESRIKLSGSAAGLVAGRWHHVALVASNGQMTMLVDGVENARQEVALKRLGGAVLIGSVEEHGGRRNFKGLIDEVRIAKFVNPNRYGFGDKHSVGALLDENYAGIWRFAGDLKNMADLTGPTGKLVGKVWYSAEVAESGAGGSNLVDYCGTTPVTNSHCRRFDEFPPYVIASNIYPDVSFTSTLAGYVFVTDNFTDDGGGSSLPNKLAGWWLNHGVNFFTPLNVSFSEPVNNLSFRVTGLDEYGYYYATVKITQQNGTISYRALRNFGYSVPVDYYLGLATCNAGPCTNVTNIQIYDISDPKGITFDNFSYTPASQPTPTPTPTTPTPTPTPYTAPPTNFTATSEVGQVRLRWAAGSTGADQYEVRRQGQGGDVLLATIPASQPPEYIDRDVKIRHYQSYRVIARLYGNPSAPTPTLNEAPKSLCDEVPTVYPPDIGLPDVQFSGHGWSGSYSKGQSVAFVQLNGRNLGHMYAAHYIKLKTNKMPSPQHIVLVSKEEHNPASNQGFLSKSIGYLNQTTSSAVNLRTSYCVASPSGQAAWFFMVNYVFSKTVPADQCEPSATLPCNRFYPYVAYWYESPTEFEETFESVQVAQRLRFREGQGWFTAEPKNTIGLFQDCEIPDLPFPMNRLDYRCHFSRFPISYSSNPVPKETYARVVANGNAAFSYDNIHQTRNSRVDPPSTIPIVPAGCFSCVHDHWRWNFASSIIPPLVIPPRLPNPWLFRFGRPLLGWDYYNEVGLFDYDVPNQDVEIGVVKAKTSDPWPPTDFRDLINNEPLGTSIRDPRGYNDFFYVATSREPNKVFDGKNRATDLIHAHGGFFNPSYSGQSRPITNSSQQSSVKGKKPELLVDGPVSVTYAHVYQDGATTFSTFDSTGTALPVGYTALNNTGYIVSTQAHVSGEHLFKFKADSVSDPTTFGNLRILHAEFDEFDPHTPMWVERTVLAPDPQEPDFPTRTLHARADSVGKFIIAVHNPSIPVPTTNVKVEGSESPDPVRADNNLTYSLLARNISNQNAGGVVLMHVLPPNVQFVSATPGQGTCQLGVDDAQLHEMPDYHNRVYCKLGTIPPNSSVPVSVVVTPTEGEDNYPAEGKLFSSTVSIKAHESDTDLEDNSISLDTIVLPSLNARPTASITSPSTNSTFVSPFLNQISIPISITATDSDGSITVVRVFDNDQFVGNAIGIGENQYQFVLNAPAYGYHNIVAQAVDDGGRSASTTGVRILVNGLSSFSFTPPQQTRLDPGSSILIETNSSVAASRIQKIELFADGAKVANLRFVAGTGGINKHQFNWQNLPVGKHHLQAVLTEYSGATTIAEGPDLTISSVPQITVNSPVDGTTYQQVTALPINTHVSDADGYIEKVDFYLNGVLTGTNTGNIESGASSFDWQNPPDGVYTLVVIATDNLGVTGVSAPISFGINRPAPSPGELIWVDDQVPSGASTGGNDGWNWMNVNPTALLGNAAHQSRLMDELHEHYFENAAQRLPVLAGESLSAWIFLDPDLPPSEIMLQFNDGNSWEHRAYWGQNLIDLGVDGTVSRQRIGDLPTGYGWKHLIIPAAQVGLVGKQVSGVKFTLYNGRATWDRVGKLAAAWNPPSPSGDFVWVEDEPPPGSILEWIHDTWTDGTWISSNPTPLSGTKAHRHWQNDFNEPYRQHSFRNPVNPMIVNPGDTLVQYVYLYPDIQYQPDTLLLQWYDDSSGWWHRAYWGRDFRYNVPHIPSGWGSVATEIDGWRYMGPIPPRGGWVRLEIPASYVGLEGKIVKGMSFTIYQKNNRGRAVWDYSGSTSSPPQNPSAIPPLKFTTPLWRIPCGSGNSLRYRYLQNKDYDFFNPGCAPATNVGYTYSYGPPGTQPIYAWEQDSRWRLDFCTACQAPFGWTLLYPVAHVYGTQAPNTVLQVRYNCNSNDYQTTAPNPPDPFPPPCAQNPHVWIYVHPN